MNNNDFPQWYVDFHETLIKYGLHETLASECAASRSKIEMEVISKFLNNYGQHITLGGVKK